MLIVSMILKILLDMVLGLLGLGLLLLVMPLEYRVWARVNEAVHGSATVSMLMRGLSMEIVYADNKTSLCLLLVNRPVWHSSQSGRGKRKKSKRSKRALRRRKMDIQGFLHQQLLTAASSFMKELFQMVRPRRLNIYGTFSFSDPSLTGISCGLIPFAKAFVPFSDISLIPVFDEEILDVDVSVYGRMIPVTALAKTLRFVAKKPVRRAIFRRRDHTKAKGPVFFTGSPLG